MITQMKSMVCNRTWRSCPDQELGAAAAFSRRLMDCPESIPIWPMAIDEPLPVLSVDVALQTCGGFPMGTGLGWDQLHPRALQRISRNAFGALMRLFMLAELLGRWLTNIGVDS